MAPAHAGAGTPFQSQFNAPSNSSNGNSKRTAALLAQLPVVKRLTVKRRPPTGSGQVRGDDPELSPIARRPADPSKETASSPSANSRAAAAAAGPLQAGSGKPTHVVHPGGGAILPAGI